MDNFISKIHIKNVRKIQNVELNISNEKRINIIFTGKNGSGKTSILESIKEYLKEQYKEYGDIILDSGMKAEIVAQWESGAETINDKIYIDFSDKEKMLEEYKKGSFIVVYFDANRSQKNMELEPLDKKIENIKLKEQYNIDEQVSTSFVKYLVDLKTQLAYAQLDGKNEELNKIKLWFDNFENLLKEIFEDKVLELLYDSKNYKFEIKSNGQQFGFDVLADGYASIIKIVMEIMMRMDNKVSNTRLYDIQGIVLIDEIETHLHVSLQKIIMPFLTKTFPNIQFVITTHSPFVLNSIPNTFIYDLQNKIQISDLSKYSYDGIIEEYFEENQYSEVIRDKIKKYEELVNINEPTDEQLSEIEDLEIDIETPKFAEELYNKYYELKNKKEISVNG